MQNLNITIEMPKNRVLDMATIKQKIVDYAMHIIYAEPEQVSHVQDKEMERAMQFVDSLVVPGGKNIPVADDGIETLVELKY